MKLKKHTHLKLRSGFTLVELLVVIAIIAALAAMSSPMIIKMKKKGDLATTTGNAKQIYGALLEFDNRKGAFPNDVTAQDDVDLNGYSGPYSNDYLGQLLASGMTDSETIFYAKGGTELDRKPDNDFSSRARTLEPGECGFAYVKNLNTSRNSQVPVLMAPMEQNGQKFKRDPYDGLAVVLRLDGSVSSLELSKDGRAKAGRRTLFDDGSDTPWGANGFNSNNLLKPRSRGGSGGSNIPQSGGGGGGLEESGGLDGELN
ncbi:prepilin-type N-terminal cleavage/methylation domain-containing protein [Persicirhabdus sediminis]|uniref:Prepilin-type N-terminal cleavage/methylation domain-containing protein n=1 Tax=Persicirhabdus sediminis TaxID=454144 RepID=A0A8J7MD00_9BACT|nr:prepilin-type N-terminal cleavage/methylation domain-containing protein [Persicirhabdus sediminis]MBK1790881.1 prepilin-type N-terminal cleavage/methylation domain-containing protein [Persicirhabdus sediminis]